EHDRNHCGDPAAVVGLAELVFGERIFIARREAVTELIELHTMVANAVGQAIKLSEQLVEQGMLEHHARSPVRTAVDQYGKEPRGAVVELHEDANVRRVSDHAEKFVAIVNRRTNGYFPAIRGRAAERSGDVNPAAMPSRLGAGAADVPAGGAFDEIIPAPMKIGTPGEVLPDSIGKRLVENCRHLRAMRVADKPARAGLLAHELLDPLLNRLARRVSHEKIARFGRLLVAVRIAQLCEQWFEFAGGALDSAKHFDELRVGGRAFDEPKIPLYLLA